MPHIPVCLPRIAPKATLAVYEEFRIQMRFPSPPNFIKTQGHAPTVARGTWELVRNVLVSGALPRSIKELMFVAISTERRCRYCKAAHIACCEMLDVEPAWIDHAANNIAALPDPKLRDMIQFAVKCANSPQSVDADDHARLARHGLGHAEIMEIISMAGLAVYANIIADATGMEEDAMFLEIGRPRASAE